MKISATTLFVAGMLFCFTGNPVLGQEVLQEKKEVKKQKMMIDKNSPLISGKKLERSKLKKVWIKRHISNKLTPAWIHKQDDPDKLKRVWIETGESRFKKVLLKKPGQDLKIKSVWIELPGQKLRLKRVWIHLPQKGHMQLKKEPD